MCGRFGANSSEAHQRQMNAPVHKWKKAWVSPTGLQPESSYKICKWVRVDMTVEDGSPAPDEDEEMEDGEEGEEGEGEGEDGAAEEDVAEGADDVEVDPEAPAVETAAAEAASTPATTAPAVEPVDTADPQTTAGVTATASEVSDPTPAPAQVPEAVESESAPLSEPTVTASAPAAVEVDSHEAPMPESHPIPANAIEIINTAPHTTEMGSGDLAGVGGVEITQGEPSAALSDEFGAGESGMDVDADVVLPAEGVAAGEAETPSAPEQPLEMDEGLIMGDNEPVREDFRIDGEDKPREVDA